MQCDGCRWTVGVHARPVFIWMLSVHCSQAPLPCPATHLEGQHAVFDAIAGQEVLHRLAPSGGVGSEAHDAPISGVGPSSMERVRDPAVCGTGTKPLQPLTPVQDRIRCAVPSMLRVVGCSRSAGIIGGAVSHPLWHSSPIRRAGAARALTWRSVPMTGAPFQISAPWQMQ